MADLLLEITRLTIADRIRLVQEILKTVATETEALPPFVLTTAQKNELDCRSDSIANGSAKTVAWESVETKLAERYGLAN